MSLILRTAAMPILLAGSIFIAVFFSACSDKTKTDLNVFKALDESLVNSNITIDKASQTTYYSLKEKLTDFATSEKATIWYPKATLIQKLSADTYKYIEELKVELKNEAGFKKEGDKESFSEDSRDVVTHLIEEHGKGKELYERLTKYRTEILAIDPELSNQFDKMILVTPQSFNIAESRQQEFNKTFFDDIPVVAALAMLSEFQNNVKNIENRMTNFCNNKVGSLDGIGFYTSYSALAIISSSRVAAGEEVEITAGVANFSKAAQPIVIINGNNVALNEIGAAVFKFKASDKPGKHLVPVEIKFTDQEGKKQTISKNIEYKVVDDKDQ